MCSSVGFCTLAVSKLSWRQNSWFVSVDGSSLLLGNGKQWGGQRRHGSWPNHIVPTHSFVDHWLRELHKESPLTVGVVWERFLVLWFVVTPRVGRETHCFASPRRSTRIHRYFLPRPGGGRRGLDHVVGARGPRPTTAGGRTAEVPKGPTKAHCLGTVENAWHESFRMV